MDPTFLLFVVYVTVADTWQNTGNMYLSLITHIKCDILQFR